MKKPLLISFYEANNNLATKVRQKQYQKSKKLQTNIPCKYRCKIFLNYK